MAYKQDIRLLKQVELTDVSHGVIRRKVGSPGLGIKIFYEVKDSDGEIDQSLNHEIDLSPTQQSALVALISGALHDINVNVLGFDPNDLD